MATWRCRGGSGGRVKRTQRARLLRRREQRRLRPAGPALGTAHRWDWGRARGTTSHHPLCRGGRNGAVGWAPRQVACRSGNALGVGRLSKRIWSYSSGSGHSRLGDVRALLPVLGPGWRWLGGSAQRRSTTRGRPARDATPRGAPADGRGDRRRTCRGDPGSWSDSGTADPVEHGRGTADCHLCAGQRGWHPGGRRGPHDRREAGTRCDRSRRDPGVGIDHPIPDVTSPPCSHAGSVGDQPDPHGS